MKKSTLIVLIIVMFALNFYSLITNVIRKNRSLEDIQLVTNFNEKLVKRNQQVREELNAIKTSFNHNIKNSNCRLDQNKVIDSSDSVKSISEVIDQNIDYFLVFRFSYLHCASCINASMDLLLKWSEESKCDNIIFIGHESNNKLFQTSLPHYGIENMKVLNTSNFQFLPLDELSFPYFFVLDKNLNVSDIFIPDKGFPNLTIEYFEMVKSKVQS